MREFEQGADLSHLENVVPDPADLAWDHAMDISGSIYARLNELGMSKKRLADALGVTPGRVSQIIKGDPGMTLKTLAKIEAALGIRFDQGFTYHPEPQNEVAAAAAKPALEPEAEPAESLDRQTNRLGLAS